jgi:UDP-N-acetylglucosamine 2-epimerase (non-hydrolysing)
MTRIGSFDHTDSDVRRRVGGVAIVLGTRPEIIKFAPVVHECRRRGIPVTVIHTGQHYSEQLDSVFFEQLELPDPAYNLGVGSKSHGAQTGQMLAGIEEILLEEHPAVVLVQGDTNSTLAGAIAAAKLSIPVGHVEAGLRSFDREMPEELNRVMVDHIATYRFAPTEATAELLRAEGIDPDSIVVVGNTVVDALRFAAARAAERSSVLEDLQVVQGEFCLLTAHRAENVDDPDRFATLLTAVGGVAAATGLEVLYPIHPRAAARLDSFGLEVPEGIRVIEPIAFLDFVRLEDAAALVLTDSGGVQEEACVLGTPCVTLRYSTERPETAYVGANMIAGLDATDVLEAAQIMLEKPADWTNPFGDGTAAAQILDAIDPALRAAGVDADLPSDPDGATGPGSIDGVVEADHNTAVHATAGDTNDTDTTN